MPKACERLHGLAGEGVDAARVETKTLQPAIRGPSGADNQVAAQDVETKTLQPAIRGGVGPDPIAQPMHLR